MAENRPTSLTAPELGFSVPAPSAEALGPVPDLFGQLREEVELAPQESSIDYETGAITLGQPKRLDLYKLYSGQFSYGDEPPMRLPELTNYVVEGIHRLPPGSTDQLRKTRTDAEILQRLTIDPTTQDLYRFPANDLAYMEGLGRGTLTNLGMIGVPTAAAAIGLSGGIPGAVLFGLAGLGAGTMAESYFFPPQRVLPQQKSFVDTGRFTADALSMAPLPFLIPKGATENAFKLFPDVDNTTGLFKDLPYLSKAYSLTTRGLPSMLETAAETARRYPTLTTGAELSAAGSGAYLGQQYAENRQQVEPSWGRAGWEAVGAVLNPFTLGSIGVSGKKQLELLYSRMTPGGQKASLADSLVGAFREFEAVYGKTPEVGPPEKTALPSVEDVARLLGEGSEVERLLTQMGIQTYGNPTSAERVGHPVLTAFQTRQAKADPGGFGQRLKNRYDQNKTAIENMLAALIEIDGADSLGLYAEARNNYYRQVLEGGLGRSLQRYQTARDTMQRNGQVIDDDAFLQTEINNIIESARAQEVAFYNRINKDYKSDASNLLGAFKNMQLETQVGTQSMRLDSGMNPISIKKALKEFEEINNRKDNPIFDEKELAEIFDDFPGLAAGTDAPDAPEGFDEKGLMLPQDITSGQLLRLRQVMVEAIGNERGNTALAQQLGILEKAIRQDLTTLPDDSTQKVKRDLDNALSFSQVFNETFNDGFLSRERQSTRPPELLSKRMLSAQPSTAALAQRDLNKYLDFFQTTLTEGTLPQSRARAALMSGDLTIPADASDSERALFEELLAGGARIEDVRLLQDKVIRGLFTRFTEPDGQVNTTKIEKFLLDPDMREVIEQVSPPIMIDGERQSPLMYDLLDTDKRAKLFAGIRDTSNPQRLERLKQNSMLMRYLEGDSDQTILDNPAVLVRNIIGFPGAERPSNPIRNFTQLVREVTRIDNNSIAQVNAKLKSAGKQLLPENVTPEQIKKAFVDSVINANYYRYGGENTDQAFDFAQTLKNINEQILPGTTTGGTRLPSVLDIMRDGGLIGVEDTKGLLDILERGARLQKATGTEDIEIIAEIFEETPIFSELAMRLVGAKLGTSVGEMLPGVSGGSSIVMAGAGSQALRKLLDKTPFVAIQDLMNQALTDPSVAQELLNLGLKREAAGISSNMLTMDAADFPIAANSLRVLRNLLIGTGAVNDLPMIEELMTETGEMGRTFFGPERERDPGGNAARRRQLLREEAERQTAQPQAMTDQARQFLPQASPPVAQAPANPDTRAQFAAMYPNDITSSLIRTQQGIGSLLS